MIEIRNSPWKWLNHLETSSIQANWPWRPSTRSPSTCSWLGCTLRNRFRDQYFCLSNNTDSSAKIQTLYFNRADLQTANATFFACSWLGCTLGNRFCKPKFPLSNSTDYSVTSQTVILAECILADCKQKFSSHTTFFSCFMISLHIRK